MPLSKDRQLFKGGGGKGEAIKVKSAKRKRGTLRSAKMIKDGMPKTAESCCKCMYNTTLCKAIKKSNKKQCNYCAVTNSRFCKLHISPKSRAGIAL